MECAMTTAANTHIAPTTDTDVAPRRTRRTLARALGVTGASLAAVTVWIVTVPVLDVDLTVRSGSASPMTVGVGPVIATSLIAAVLGWLLLAVL